MGQNEQVAQALFVHGAILVAALAAYIKYGDRSELIAKSLGGVEATLARLSANIAGDLDAYLRPLFEDQVVNVKIELPEGYEEERGDPIGSEAYRDALKEFTAEHAVNIADLWKLRSIRDSWCYWAQCLSWLIYAVAAYEILSSGYFGIAVRVLGHVPPDWAVAASFVPTAFLVLGVLLSAVLLLIRHDSIVKIKMRHDAP